MRSLYQVLKASKLNPVFAPDMITALWAKNISGGGSAPTEHEYTGTVPTPITANGEPLIEWILKGNFVQSSQPSAVVVNVYPTIDDNSINHGYWGTTYDYDRYLPDEPAYLRSNPWMGMGNEIYLDVGTYTFSVYVKAEYNLSNAASLYIMELNGYPHYSEAATLSVSSQAIPTLTQAYQRYSITFEVTAAGYVCPRVEKTDDSGTGVIVTCYQLESGSTATPYIAYGKSVISPIYPSECGDLVSTGEHSGEYVLPIDCGGVTTNVYTAEPLRKIGEYADYKSESAEYRAVRKFELTGQENGWRLTGSGRMALAFISSQNPLRNVLCICSHYKGTAATAYGDLADGDCTVSTMNGNNSELGIYDTNYTTLADFKTYLQQQYANGTPVCVWYVLATPTTESITAPEIPTTAGSQTFDVDTELKPSEVYIKYKG